MVAGKRLVIADSMRLGNIVVCQGLAVSKLLATLLTLTGFMLIITFKEQGGNAKLSLQVITYAIDEGVMSECATFLLLLLLVKGVVIDNLKLQLNVCSCGRQRVGSHLGVIGEIGPSRRRLRPGLKLLELAVRVQMCLESAYTTASFRSLRLVPADKESLSRKAPWASPWIGFPAVAANLQSEA